jgi:hypothetical protein
VSVAARALALAAGVLFVTVSVGGCGKYGKPVRQPPEPREHVLLRADPGEKRYTSTTSTAATSATPHARPRAIGAATAAAGRLSNRR